jgi:hypothetical protein
MQLDDDENKSVWPIWVVDDDDDENMHVGPLWDVDDEDEIKPV